MRFIKSLFWMVNSFYFLAMAIIRRSLGTLTWDFAGIGALLTSLLFAVSSRVIWCSFPTIDLSVSLGGLCVRTAMPPACYRRRFGLIDLIYFDLIEYEFVIIRFFIWFSVLSIVFDVTLLLRKGPTTCWTCIKWFARTSSINFSCSALALMALSDTLGLFPKLPGG